MKKDIEKKIELINSLGIYKRTLILYQAYGKVQLCLQCENGSGLSDISNFLTKSECLEFLNGILSTYKK